MIAHEVGHHVQNQLGIMDQVQSAQQRAGTQAEANSFSVKLELQADCFAGVWANNTEKERNILEQGDIEEGLTAASSIGDDRLQMEYQGKVTPDSFTHGTSAEGTLGSNQGWNLVKSIRAIPLRHYTKIFAGRLYANRSLPELLNNP